MVSKVGDKVGPKSGRQGSSTGSKTKLIFNKFFIFFKMKIKRNGIGGKAKAGILFWRIIMTVKNAIF